MEINSTFLAANSSRRTTTFGGVVDVDDVVDVVVDDVVDVVVDVANTEMLNVRWQIPPGEQLHLVPCGHCFAQLVFENMRG